MEEIKYLLLTIVVEAPVALIFLRKQKWTQVLFVVLCVNMVSHPLGWQSIAHGASWRLTEFCIAGFEGVIFYFLFPAIRYRATITAVGMNVVSALIGIIA